MSEDLYKTSEAFRLRKFAFYTSILTGFSRKPANACTFGYAASVPSPTRWGTEVAAFMCQPTFKAPFSATGTSPAELINNIAVSGGLMMAMKSSTTVINPPGTVTATPPAAELNVINH